MKCNSLQAGDFSETASDQKHIYNSFVHIINYLKNKSGNLLNAGAGDGSFERLLRSSIKKKLNITSLDINPYFENHLSQVSDDVVFLDLTKDYLDRKFDIITCIDVIEHVLETDNLLLNIKKMMNQDSVFILQTPNLASWHSRLSLLFGYMPESMEVSMIKGDFGKFFIFRGEEERTIHHVRVFTYRALREIVEYHGFKIINTFGGDHRVPHLFKKLPSIASTVCMLLEKK
jgi:2-polyprenyl-3-methyl-5-hydroxy-6-metoxy-1,4-benzoquinol methylase